MVLLLHLHEIVEGLYFHSSLSVCLSVCLCVRLCLRTKFQPNGCTDLEAVFVKRLLRILAQTLLKLVILGQRLRFTVAKDSFFLHNSLSTSLLCISALLWAIKLKFGMLLRHTHGRFVFKSYKNRHCDVN